MKKLLKAVGLIVSTSFVLTVLSINKAEASCVGSQCNDKDPGQQGCSADARDVDRKSFGIFPTNTIILRYSEKCRANWAKADVPVGTLLYIEELYAPGNKRGYYTTEVNGQSFSNMSTGNVPNRACALLPGESYPQCTEFK